MLCAAPEPQVSQTLYYVAPFVATRFLFSVLLHVLLLLLFFLLLLLFLFIFIFIFICVIYIWSKKNLLKVEFLINKTPSNTDLLPKTTRYHHRFWNIYQKNFILCMLSLFTWSVHALFVLAIYMIYACLNFLFIYLFLPQNKYYSSSKNLTNLLYFSFLLWVLKKIVGIEIYLLIVSFFFFFFWLLRKNEENKIENVDGK